MRGSMAGSSSETRLNQGFGTGVDTTTGPVGVAEPPEGSRVMKTEEAGFPCVRLKLKMAVAASECAVPRLIAAPVAGSVCQNW